MAIPRPFILMEFGGMILYSASLVGMFMGILFEGLGIYLKGVMTGYWMEGFILDQLEE